MTTSLKTLLLTFVLGAVSVAGYAPLGWYPLSVLSLAVFFALLGPASPGQAWRLGLAYGLGLFLTGMSWVYVSMTTYGGMPLPIAVLATVLFCAVLAAFPTFACWLGVRFASGALRLTLALPAAWVLGEWLRGWVFTGLPWLALGYSQAPSDSIASSPLAGYAPLLGVYGVSLMTALVAGMLATLVPSVPSRSPGRPKIDLPPTGGGSDRRAEPGVQPTTRRAHGRRGFLPDLLAIGLLLTGWGLQQIDWTRPEGTPVSVELLQGNVAQSMKFEPEHIRHALIDYARQIEASPAKLIVLPETALPLLRSQLPDGYLDHLAALAARRGADVVVGIPEDQDRAYYNSAISLGASPSTVYRKVHLVPFGEFVPWGFRWAVDMMRIPLGDFGRGAPDQAPMAAGGLRLAMNICYEDVFGEERIAAARDAHLLVNISNDAWFGHSLAPWQHLQIGAMRSLEAGRWQLRANNTGVTAVLDERGRVRAQLPIFSHATLSSQVQGYSGLTPYLRWGNWPVLALIAGLLILAAWRSRSTPVVTHPQALRART